ncbi:MAG: UDP-glucose 4-epimerase GalE [Clostridia bacterium]|nr:UDP-glucose 4-epimerase GalE [Clostridia bacterium]
MNILVTGGTGFIGSHTCVELLASGHKVVIVDNLYNSKRETAGVIEDIAKKKVTFYETDLLDEASLEEIFSENSFDAVIHFAGYKAVGESVEKPLEYYNNNIGSTLTLCRVMRKHGVKKLVFSSSATVYGAPESVPVTEDFPLSATNPYGSTKLFIEYILKDLYNSDNGWDITLLRYFNPVGAHESGLIGEDPNGIPNNLMPYIAKVAMGELPYLHVFGNDYGTHDGTGVRDYIHVVDLAKGHVKAIENMKGLAVYNLGTGTGYSVLDIVSAYEKANGIKIPYKIEERRSGDVDMCYADPSKARKELGWSAELGIEEMCRSSFAFASMHKK